MNEQQLMEDLSKLMDKHKFVEIVLVFPGPDNGVGILSVNTTPEAVKRIGRILAEDDPEISIDPTGLVH